MTAADAGSWPDCRSAHHAAVLPTELGAADIGEDPPALATIEAGADDINFGGCQKYALGLRQLLGGGVKCTSKGHVTGPVAAILANVTSSLVNAIAMIDNESHGLARVLVVDYYEPIPSHRDFVSDHSQLCDMLRLNNHKNGVSHQGVDYILRADLNRRHTASVLPVLSNDHPCIPAE